MIFLRDNAYEKYIPVFLDFYVFFVEALLLLCINPSRRLVKYYYSKHVSSLDTCI
jgi:hypothetical protein